MLTAHIRFVLIIDYLNILKNCTASLKFTHNMRLHLELLRQSYLSVLVSYTSLPSIYSH